MVALIQKAINTCNTSKTAYWHGFCTFFNKKQTHSYCCLAWVKQHRKQCTERLMNRIYRTVFRGLISTQKNNSRMLIAGLWKNPFRTCMFQSVQSVCHVQKQGCHSSALFNSDRYGNVSNFQFDHGLDILQQNLNLLKANLKLRSSGIDADALMADYARYCELKQQKEDVESRREAIAQQIAAIVKHQKLSKVPSKEATKKLRGLKEEGKKVKQQLKHVQAEYWEVEEKVMLTALALPNHTLSDTEKEMQVHGTYFLDRIPTDEVDHYTVLENSGCVRLSNVGAQAYYLVGRLAVLEQELIDRLSVHLTQTGFTPILAPEIYKIPVLEGGGIDVCDTTSVYRLQHKQGTNVSDWDQEHAFLAGASHLSFLAFFARIKVPTGNLPIQLFTVGRNYHPGSINTCRLPGLYGCLQSVKVCIGGVCRSSAQCEEVMSHFLSVLTTLYTSMQLPFRVVSMSAKALQRWEQNRLEIQVWVPSMQDFLKVAMVSVHGDYSSRRLMMHHTAHLNATSLPVHMVYGEVADISQTIACLLEYGRTHEYWGSETQI